MTRRLILKINLIVLLLGGALTGCTGGLADSKSDDPDDDAEIVIPVPMGLVDLEAIALYQERLGKQSVQSASAAARQAPADLEGFSEPILGAPALAAVELSRLLAMVHKSLERFFGSEKFLGDSVAVARGSGKVVRLVSKEESLANGVAEFAVVSAQDAEARYPFLLELFYRQADGQLARRFVVEFRPSPTDGEKSQARFVYQVPAEAGGLAAQHVELFFDEAAAILEASYSPEPLEGSIPAQTKLRLTELSASRFLVEGGYIWDRMSLSPPLGEIYARYAGLETGDIELFRYAVDEAALSATQELAFLPAGTSAAHDFKRTPGLFDEHDYFDVYLVPFLVRVLRDPAIHPGCEAIGATLQAIVATAPASDNLCNTNASVTDATVGDTITQACAADTDLAIAVVGGTSFPLCETYLDGKSLANRQAFVLLPSGGRELVTSASQLTAAHPELNALLETRDFFDYQSLTTTERESVLVVGPERFRDF